MIFPLRFPLSGRLDSLRWAAVLLSIQKANLPLFLNLCLVSATIGFEPPLKPPAIKVAAAAVAIEQGTLLRFAALPLPSSIGSFGVSPHASSTGPLQQQQLYLLAICWLQLARLYPPPITLLDDDDDDD